MHAYSNLPCVASFRSEWQYNNWDYALAARLVDEQSRKNWIGSVNSILHELSLCRKSTGPSVDKNIAKAYIVLSDGRSIKGTLPSLQGGDAFRMPTTAINLVTNSPEASSSYTLGETSPPRAAIGHTGHLGSFTCACWVFSDTESAVVILTNASSVNGDSSNIVAQFLIQVLFSLEPEIDFISIAKRAKIAAQNIWRKTCTLWWSNRHIGIDSRDHSAYIGSYISTDLRMTLHITTREGQVVSDKAGLDLCIDDLSGQKMRLYHYHHDAWNFFPGSRDECLMQGLGVFRSSWRAFNLDCTRFGVNNFRGISTRELAPSSSVEWGHEHTEVFRQR